MEKKKHTTSNKAKHAFKKEGANLIANLVLTNIDDGHEKSKSNMDLLHCSKLFFSLLHNIGNLI
jgi:hypothetical protein